MFLAFLSFPTFAVASTATPDDNTVGATTNYSVTFTIGPGETLSKSGEITLTFSSVEFTLASTMIASSADIDGGFEPATPSGSSVTFVRDSTGTTLASGTYMIRFGTVTNPTTPGSHSINVTTNEGTSDPGDPFSIAIGSKASIRINDAAGSGGSEVGDLSRTTDQSVTLFAASYDAFGNFISDEPVDWAISGGIGTLSNTTNASSTTLDLNAVGSGSVTADDGLGHTDATGTITVTVGALDNIVVVEGESGNGVEMGGRSITTDQTLTVHAAGFDSDGNYRGDESVSWSVTGGIGSVSSGIGVSTTFDATTVGSGTIDASHATAGTDATGTIDVSVGVLNFVRVNSGVSGETSEVTTNTLTTGEDFSVHASGYDADGNYRNDESVSWSVTGGIGTLSSNSGASTTLTATTPGTGVIEADHASARDDATGTITVNSGSIASILIRNAPDNGGIEVGSVDMTADETLTLFAASYDAEGNYLGDVSVSWSASSGNLDPEINGTGSSFTFSPTTAPANGVIRATHSTAGSDDTGTIDVSVGVLNFVRVNSGVSGETSEVTTNTLTTGEEFSVHASGYDADGNYRNDESVSWSVTGGIGTLSPGSGTTTTLTATTPGTGVIQADHASALDDATGSITVVLGNVDHVIIRDAPNNGGNEVADVNLTADDSITVYAAGYDGQNNFLGDVSVTWRSTGSLDPTGDVIGSSFTFEPETAPASGQIVADHSSATDDSTGTVNVSPGLPDGNVTLTADPDTLAADGISTSQITSSQIVDADRNLVAANQLFTVTLSDPNLGTITTADADAGRQGHQIATNASSQLDFEFQAGTLSGTLTVFVSSVGGSATGQTNIVIGSLNISSISTAPDFVSQGQSGITVNMVAQNVSASQITDVSGSLTFTGTVDRTGEYTVQRTDNVTSIPAQEQRTLTFNVTVNANASLELIAIDGQVSGLIGATPVSSQGAATTDSWTVQRRAQLSAVAVTSQLDSVVVGQLGNSVTVSIANPAPAAAATAIVDNVELRFLQNGVTDRSTDFTVSADGGNPTSIPAGQQSDFNFTVGIGGSAIPGDYELDAAVTGHDTNSTALTLQDTNADTRHDWFVKGAPSFQILSITTAPTTSFIAGQSTPWTVRMEVKNNGPDPVKVDFSAARTFIRFIRGVTDVTGEYTIQQPIQLVVSGSDTLKSGATDTLDFTVTQTGVSTGTIRIEGRVEGTDLGTGNPIADDTDDGGSGQVDILSQSATLFIAQTTPSTINESQGVGIVNTSQPFQISIDVKNDLQEAVENVSVQLTTNGSSAIAQSPLIIPLIPANQAGSLSFNVTAAPDSDPSGETFTAQILGGTGQQSQQPAQIGTPLDDDVIVRIQTPASLSVEFTEIEPFQTAGERFSVEATVTNAGEAEVDNSGEILLTIPTSYSLVSGSPASRPFTVGDPVQWEIDAPDITTGVDTFIVSIDESPIELNTNSAATVTAADSQEVQTLAVDLIIDNFNIVNPAGAEDNVLSTEQIFDVQASIGVSE
ncbi:hypothetical protein GWO43_28225, partial [candidate division KSB1 bacterium]|nr:hypothetical protein [candidate division KSB1 bacterium]NIT74677.1 hypothetical protein [candidate division KSB1 bacterium]NIX74357.1 hypothetical protein [candidate division KSB1 bacterium]